MGLQPVSSSSAARTGELHPGRWLVRPRVRFTSGNGGDGWSDKCAKSYRFAAIHSPGLFTLQCASAYPQLICITVTMSYESIANAVTTILSRFKRIPAVLFYHNA